MTSNLNRFFAAVATFSIILTALVLSSRGQRKDEPVALPFSDAPYLAGERLTYNIAFANFVTAGHVELSVVGRTTFQGREAIQMHAHAETKGVIYAALFALNNDYTSYVDPSTGLPFHTQQVINSLAQPKDVAADLNQAGGPGTYDFLSALYRLRSMPLADGGSYSLNVRDESQEFQIELKVKGRESIRTNVGSFNTIATQLRVQNNSRANDYRIQINFSDDPRHIPVLITAKHPAGPIRVELAASQLIKTETARPESPPGGNHPTPTPTPTPRPSPRPTPPQNTPPPPAKLSADLPFKIGEELNYQVFLASVQQPIGIISFQIRSQGRYFEHNGVMLTCTAQTTNAAQKLFFANDQLTSYVDPLTLLPYRNEFNLIEGRHRANDILTINQDYGTANRQDGRRLEIPVGTHDYLSLFYGVRAMNITPPKTNAVSILVNNRPKTLKIGSVKRETIQLGNQKIPAIQLSLTTDDPQPDKYMLRAWISDDDRRLLLRLTATTELGPIRADLAIVPLTRQ